VFGSNNVCRYIWVSFIMVSLSVKRSVDFTHQEILSWWIYIFTKVGAMSLNPCEKWLYGVNP